MDKQATLYHDVAGRITKMIDHGAFGPGDRIPSVRKLSAQLDVSVTTVLRAYRVLENDGLIEARPQSGYYVRNRFPARAAEPGISKPPLSPSNVSVDELVMKMLHDAKNPRLVKLGAAAPNPDLLPSDKLHRTMAALARRFGSRAEAYDFPPGLEALRIQVAQRAVAVGCTLSPDDIVTTCGTQEAVTLALRAVCKPGGTVVLESPTYYGFLQAIEALGLKALEIPTHPRTGMSIDALRLAIEQTPIDAVLVVPNFGNPLGSCMPEESRRELVELLAEREIPLIEDDIYGELYSGEERVKAAKSFDEKGLVLLAASFSKTLSPGVRVGWIAAGRFRERVERLKMATTLATPTLGQMAVAEFLAHGGYDHHLRKIRKIYARQVAAMAQAVGRHFPEGTKVTRPTGGYVLWVEMPAKVNALKLYEIALKNDLNFAPGPIFTSSKQKFRSCLRLNCAMWGDAAEKAVAKLGKLAGEMAKG